MKKILLIAATVLSSSAALADGFVCHADEQDLKIKVYNHTRAEDGTRNAAVMVISDKTVQAGRKTIARFTGVNETLGSKGAVYTADVDLRFTDSARKGENIGGTKLGSLDSIVLDIEFSYAQPLAHGDTAPGQLTLVKRTGGVIVLDVECERYLKGE